MSAPRMLLTSFLDNQACTGQPGMHQHHGKQQLSAAVEEPYQASLIAAYVVLISKLTMQGSAGTVQQDGSCSCHE